MRALATSLLIACALGVASCSDMPLAPGAVVHLDAQVVDREGAPVANAQVYLRSLDPLPENPPPQDPGWPNQPTATTDAQGHFRVDLAEATYKVDVEPDYYSGLPALHVEPLAISRADPNPVLRYSGVYLRGHVFGPAGAELPQIIVQAYNQAKGVSTAYQGSSPFRLLLSPGVHHMMFSGSYPSGLPTLDTTIVVGDHDDSLQVTLTGHLVHIHVTANQYTPLPGAAVTASSIHFFGYGVSYTDLNGDATMYLRTGAYVITVDPRVRGMAPWSFTTLIQGDASLAYDLSPVQWSGTVRSSADQTPIPFALVSLREFSVFGGGTSMQAASDGSFSLLLRPGTTYEVYGYAAGFGPTPSFVTLGADSTFDLVLDPNPYGVVQATGTSGARLPTRTLSTPAPPAGPGSPGPGSSGR